MSRFYRSKFKDWYTAELGRLENYIRLLNDLVRSVEDVFLKGILQSRYIASRKEYRIKVLASKKKPTERIIAESHNPSRAA